jgi:putative ABC transport system permease protein
MIRFLLKGLLRDKSRSAVPIAIVAVGVMLSVFIHAYITGIMGDSIEMNARFSTGHVKVVTKAYSENMVQMPNDLALMGVSGIKQNLELKYPDILWVERIHFGGLADAPDKNGETKSQGPAFGMGIDLLSGKSGEIERLKLEKSLVRGHLPEKKNEVLLSELFSQKLKVNPGDEITLIGSTMFGSMSYYNFLISGTISFGSTVLDKSTIIADIEGVREALDMADAASEITGYFKSGYYSAKEAIKIKEQFNSVSSVDKKDEFAPVMVDLQDQNNMKIFVEMAGSMGAIITLIFMVAMSLVLWNAGLLGGLRRYGEVGVRLAMGEEKGHVYKTLLCESVLIGIIGTIIGTVIGLCFAWLMQEYGLDLGSKMKGSSVMLPTIVRARITVTDLYIGFIPGLISTFIGTALSGRGIYKRKTAQLFKELEA